MLKIMYKIFITKSEFNEVQKENRELKVKLETVIQEQQILKEAEVKGLKDEISYLKTEVDRYRISFEKQRIREDDIREEERMNYKERLEENEKAVEEKIEQIVKGRVITTVGEVKTENESLKKKLEDINERNSFYKARFESGKVELGAAEIKGLLLAANPAGDRIVRQLKDAA